MRRPSPDLAVRLAPFVDAGLLSALPNRWQILQGECAMAPWVISTDVTDETAYRRHLLAHPVVRQPLLFAVIGRDHFAMGTGLGSRLESVIAHLHLTLHSGFPVFDMQLIQTHPDGLDALRRATKAVLAGHTPQAARRMRLARRLFVDPAAYYGRFVETGGWIDRAAAFDYPSPTQEESRMPAAFFGLASFLQHCADAYPATVAEVGRARVPGHLLHLLGHRFRAEGGLGWLAAARRLVS